MIFRIYILKKNILNIKNKSLKLYYLYIKYGRRIKNIN